MIVTSDPISSIPSYGRMATLAPNARSGETPQALTADSVAPELTSTQIAAAVDKSATDNKQQAQQQAQNQAALHQQAAQPQAAQQQQAAAPAPVTTAEASKFLTYANQWFAQHASALNATASYNQTSALKTSSPQPTNAPASEDAPASSSPQVVSPQEQKSATTSVLKSLIYGVPLSGDAKRLISGPDSFIGLNGLSADMQKLAQENSNYVFDTPLGKMTYQDLEQLSRRMDSYVQNPTFTTRFAALEIMQDIAARQDELGRQYAQQTPFEQIQEQQRLAAADRKTEDRQDQQAAQEQLDPQVRAKVEHLEAQQDIQAQVRKLRSADHEADQDFLNTLKFSYDLLRS